MKFNFKSCRGIDKKIWIIGLQSEWHGILQLRKRQIHQGDSQKSPGNDDLSRDSKSIKVREEDDDMSNNQI